MYLKRLEIVVLERKELKALPSPPNVTLSARPAALADLEAMREEGCWDIRPRNMESFHAGDVCVLSFVNDELAGYTWIHTEGRPTLYHMTETGMTITVPEEYLYNYDGFTHPRFRGLGLQGFRHRAALTHPEWRERRGLLGYVDHVNFSSRRGQRRSGYRRIGTLTLVGTENHYRAFFSEELEAVGIGRALEESPVD
jgi:hypothetical protein